MVNKKNILKRKHFWRLSRSKQIMLYLMAYDAIVINAAYFMALWLRFDLQFASIPQQYLSAYLGFAPFYTIFCLFLFWKLKLYQSIWQYASVTEANRVILATGISSVAHIILITFLFQRMPLSYYIFGSLFQFVLVAFIRFVYRLLLWERAKHSNSSGSISSSSRILLIGAGDAGQMILHDIQRSKLTQGKVYAIIDDDSNKWERSISGVPVVGGRDEILSAVKKYNINKIYFTLNE